MKLLRENQQGYTLIELMIAVSLSSMIFFMVGTMLVADQRQWSSMSKKVNLAADVSAVMAKIRSEIMLGSAALDSPDKVSVEGDSLINIGSKYLTSNINGDLIFNDGSGDKAMFKGIVSSLSFSFPAVTAGGELYNAVGIDLTVEDENLQRHLTSTVFLRN